jgi:hypothetical protein
MNLFKLDFKLYQTKFSKLVHFGQIGRKFCLTKKWLLLFGPGQKSWLFLKKNDRLEEETGMQYSRIAQPSKCADTVTDGTVLP